jgi:hypothetical protein
LQSLEWARLSLRTAPCLARFQAQRDAGNS